MLAVQVNFISLHRIFLSNEVWIVTCVKYSQYLQVLSALRKL